MLFSSVTQSCSTLCNSMDCSMPGLPVHHQFLEIAQTHVHQVGDAIQPSHPLLSPSPPASNLSQHQGFSNELTRHIRWPMYWNFSFGISPSNEYLGLIFVNYSSIKLGRKPILHDISMARLVLFWLLFAFNNFFNPFTFNLFKSLGLKWAFCRQYIVVSCVFIPSANSVCWLESLVHLHLK